MKSKLNSEIKLDVSEIFPGIFHVTCDNKFDLAMTFLRSQEFYESDNPKVRNKPFSMIEYIRWYAQSRELNMFTYPRDWAGFNVPSGVIKKALESGRSDWNIYDAAMDNLVASIPHSKFYLIGTMHKNEDISKMLSKSTNEFHHEIAHALYYLDKEYKSTCDELISQIPDDIKNAIYVVFSKYGYAKRVWDDEVQAYMISGIKNLNGSEGIDLAQIAGIQAKFVKLFKKTIKEKSAVKS